jgi:hypothetical protein
MKKYIQIVDGVARAEFSCLQDEGAFPGVIEVNADDPRYLALLEKQNPTAAPVSDIAAVWAQIKAERELRTLTGGFQAGGYWFHSDQLSRDQQIKLFLAGAALPQTPWKTMSGEFVVMSQELATAIITASGASDIAIFGAAEVHRAAMEASANPTAYDYSESWPLTFEEWAAAQEIEQ